jgi:hypothetical protein
MTTEEIKHIQRKVGVEDDGYFGRLSIAATQKYLRDLMPKPNPWPASDRASVESFFGKPGDESNLVLFDFPFPTYYEGKRVLRGRCHKKVKDSLVRVLTDIGDRYGDNREIIEEAEDYSGIYNYRPKRGGTSLSLHSWGIAIDLDVDDNAFRDHWPMKADMNLEVMECFAREGWLSAAAFWQYDAQHFQATR